MTNSNGALSDGICNSPPGEKDSATQPVQVAVHIRPLIASEQLQGCKDCVTVVPGEPQIQIGNNSYTFDHVYGSSASPSSAIFDECVAPLVEGLFLGYNATVLAYGQTGSGKTYTMGTGYTMGGSTDGVIPQVMDMIYKKVETSSEKMQLKVRVSFIEILNEEVHDLLDSSPSTSGRSEVSAGFGARPTTPVKPSIQIREATNGEITLVGVTEVDVNGLTEMAALLEQGSLSRATASTNMNSHSSRSHAILTITLQQRQKLDPHANGNSLFQDNEYDDSLCAKLHLVDLAGSERVKRTGADGLRFKEGVHINKGLLALGNVISALGDEKKRKDGGHVPYRDSKLTRLLQDSLGGNSRTVMIACISPADSNAEETLNTLKYANRARNIQNKPIVNRDPMAAEMQRMRQQVESLQAELLCMRAGCGESGGDTQMLKQKIAWLEASNAKLQQELQQARDGLQFCAQRVMDALMERDDLLHKLELLRAGKTWDELDNDAYQRVQLFQAYTTKMHELGCNIQPAKNVEPQALISPMEHPIVACANESAGQYVDFIKKHENHHADMRQMGRIDNEEDEEAAAEELEHTRLQASMGKELQELNERLQQKEAEMKSFVKPENMVLREQFEKKLTELEEEKKTLQVERDTLLVEIENLACVSDEQAQKIQAAYVQKLKDLESQLVELKQMQDNQTHLLKQKIRSEEAAKHLQEEIQRIKTQKVQLQHRIKQESEYFRFWKASREKELQQLRKEGRKNEYELHKLQALNQRQKMVLQRKTEEAAMATRRLKELLEARKSSMRESSNAGSTAPNGSLKQVNQKSLHKCIDQELEVAVHIHVVRSNYEKQAELRASLAKELDSLIKEDELQRNMLELHLNKSEEMPLSLLPVPSSFTSSDARRARIDSLKAMLENSSQTLVAMASELSEAEERERTSTGRGRWQQLRTMGDAKSLLHYVFNMVIDARCRLWDKDMESKELKEKVTELMDLLRQSEACRKEMGRQQQRREHAIAKAIATSTKLGSEVSISCDKEDLPSHLLHLQGSNSHGMYQSSTSNVSYRYGYQKFTNRGLRSGTKQTTQVGKLLRWKRSHERWLLQFKWKWQKPWRLSEWIRHGDESLTRAKSSRFSSMMEIK